MISELANWARTTNGSITGTILDIIMEQENRGAVLVYDKKKLFQIDGEGDAPLLLIRK